MAVKCMVFYMLVFNQQKQEKSLELTGHTSVFTEIRFFIFLCFLLPGSLLFGCTAMYLTILPFVKVWMIPHLLLVGKKAVADLDMHMFGTLWNRGTPVGYPHLPNSSVTVILVDNRQYFAALHTLVLKLLELLDIISLRQRLQNGIVGSKSLVVLEVINAQ